MAHLQTNSGYFGIGIENPKRDVNIGTLWRSASILGAAFIFTVGSRYRKQSSDTSHAWTHIPLFHYENIPQLRNSLPFSCMLVGAELEEQAVNIMEFRHPPRCMYLLGSEDYGLSREAVAACHQLVRLPGEQSLNVAVAGSLLLYDRIAKGSTKSW